MSPIDTPTTAALHSLARTDEDRARVELAISEAHRTADAADALDRADVAELGRGRCPRELLAPFTRRARS